MSKSRKATGTPASVVVSGQRRGGSYVMDPKSGARRLVHGTDQTPVATNQMAEPDPTPPSLPDDE